MRKTTCKYLSKAKLQEANRRAIRAGRNAIDPEYIEGLSDNMEYPVFFKLALDCGWVRCQVRTAKDSAGRDYTPVWLDVPPIIYDPLRSVEVDQAEEATA